MFIPTYCDGCSRAALVAEKSIAGGVARCSECGKAARALPGETYGEDDVALFNDLRAALEEVGLTPQHATGLATQLEIRRTQPPGQGLRQLAQMLPSLGILELIVANRTATLRKAESMLATLLETITSNRRSQSGMLRVVGEGTETTKHEQTG